ncbi:MAG: HNH endonuclease, partial [Thaumarchaeota archaeon]|nr:HNH endonuclease [Nitrososphaerota archaeon]
MPLPYSEAAIRNLLSKCVENRATGCIEYTGRLNEKGYARLWFDGKAQYAHRVMLAMKLRRHLEEGEIAMHECDNRKCCNPKHLKAGTVLENNIDREKKGRRGERKAKYQMLTRDDVAQIKLALRMHQSAET